MFRVEIKNERGKAPLRIYDEKSRKISYPKLEKTESIMELSEEIENLYESFFYDDEFDAEEEAAASGIMLDLIDELKEEIKDIAGKKVTISDLESERLEKLLEEV